MSCRSLDLPTTEPEPTVAEPEAPRPLGELVRPNFFAGQLLTDQDLMALLGWAQGKLGLARQRHGWGVVCGLGAGLHPQQPGALIVEPGYALGPAGEDIVLPSSQILDLGSECAGDAYAARNAGAGELADMLEFAGFGLPTAELRVADLVVGYEETPGEPQAPLASGPCADRVECEYGRVVERAVLHHRPGAVDRTPADDALDRWLEAFAATARVLTLFREELPPGRRAGDTVRRWLERWMSARAPLYELCWIREQLDRLSDEALAKESVQAHLLFWLVQDARAEALTCCCAGGSGGDRVPPKGDRFGVPPKGDKWGVPLARVWLRAVGSEASIVFIDAKPPHRRPVGPCCWPAPLGRINLARALVRRWPDACVRLSELGVPLAGSQPVSLPGTLEELRALLAGELFSHCGGRPLVARVLDAGPQVGQRVVGFALAPEPPPPVVEAPASGLRVSKRSDLAEARPGDKVTYTYQAVNTGEVPLSLQLVDSLYGTVTPEDEIELAAGGARDFTAVHAVPADAPEWLVTRVNGVGINADGHVVESFAEHRLQVLSAPAAPEPEAPVPEAPVPEAGQMLELIKIAAVKAAFPYQKVSYSYTVTNLSGAEITAQVWDEDAGAGKVSGKRPLRIPAGASHAFSAAAQVPGEARGELRTVPRTAGRSADGRTAEATTVHVLPIRQPDDLLLIGMLQATGMGRLTDVKRAHEAQIFTFRQFADASPEKIYQAYSWTFQAQRVKSTGLVEEWQEKARLLAGTPIHQAHDVLALTDAELQRLLPGLTERRLRALKKRARKRADKLGDDWSATAPAEDPDEPSPAGAAGAAGEAHAIEASEAAEDDFSILEGMTSRGPRKLRRAGILTFADLADATTEELRQAGITARARKVQRWIDQARQLAGDSPPAAAPEPPAPEPSAPQPAAPQPAAPEPAAPEPEPSTPEDVTPAAPAKPPQAGGRTFDELAQATVEELRRQAGLEPSQGTPQSGAAPAQQPEIPAVPEPEPEPAAPVAEVEEPEEEEPEPAERQDDFSLLEGMTSRGPKKLQAGGYRTFADLARATVADLRRAGITAAERKLRRWIEQAGEKSGPAATEAAEPGDDFSQLDGMTVRGPKKLQAGGYWTFADLARATVEDLRRAGITASERKAQRWIEQAEERADD